MSYGMRIWGGDGSLQIDENSFTMRVVLSTLVSFTNAAKTNQDSVSYTHLTLPTSDLV